MGFWGFIGLASKKNHEVLENRLNKVTELLEESVNQRNEMSKELTLIKSKFESEIQNLEKKIVDDNSLFLDRVKTSEIKIVESVKEVNSVISEDVVNKLSAQAESILKNYEQFKTVQNSIVSLEATLIMANKLSTDNLESKINLNSDYIQKTVIDTIDKMIYENKESLKTNTTSLSKELTAHINQISTQNSENGQKIENLELLSDNLSEVVKMILVNTVVDELKTVSSQGV